MPLSRPLTSLGAKLALFFLALGLPVLLVLETLNLSREFVHLVREIDRGSLERAASAHALRIGAELPRLDSAEAVAARLGEVVLRLRQPDGGLSREARHFLLEVGSEPIAARLVSADGRVVTAGGEGAFVAPAWREALAGRATRHASDRDGLVARSAVVPVRDAKGAVVAALGLSLELPPPWRKLFAKLSFEWPMMFATLVVLALATLVFFRVAVTRRIDRIARAAERWSVGDFAVRTGARGFDELARLGARLDAMAGELAEHVATRARLASLEERQRLARDLHDTVKQRVFALNLQLGAAASVLARDGAEAGRRLHEAEGLIVSIQDQLDAILTELRDGDAAFELAPALKALAGDWSRMSGIGAVWDRCDAATLPRWMGEQALALAEEALANVWRHSGALRATLALVACDGTYALSVRDDGRGLAGTRSGMGLDNMRSRAATLPGGTLEIASDAGNGTAVVARWRADGWTKAA